jgi:type II secretory pathway pseudopilin PulG
MGLKDNSSMQLAGQGSGGNRGYAMVMLLVAMGVMAVVWTTALPAWSQLAKREKEEELIFRGNQYARAIGLFQRKYANQSPPSIQVLLEQKFLRKKYKDPMVPDGEFQLLYQTVQQPGSSGRGQPAGSSGRGQPQGAQGRANQPSGTTGLPGGIAIPGQVTGAPIIGVTSNGSSFTWPQPASLARPVVPLAHSLQTVGVAGEGAAAENRSNSVAVAGGGGGLLKTGRADAGCSNRIKTAADAEWERHRVADSVSHHLTATLISLSRPHHLTVNRTKARPPFIP